jgi:hypothetical protein
VKVARTPKMDAAFLYENIFFGTRAANISLGREVKREKLIIVTDMA